VPRPLALRTDFALERTTAFSYECHGCGRCCFGKTIPVNPYEVARIAALLGTTTTDVLARLTAHGGATLATREDGGCVFLSGRTCGIHDARPLACRLYPLGRRLSGGAERFAEVVPQPESEGVYGRDGDARGQTTVGDYLRAQGADAFIAAAERYVAVLARMLPVLAAREDTEDVREEATGAMQRAPLPADESWLDVDAVVATWCAERGEPAPEGVDAKVALHLRALEAFLAVMQG
jgi:Fe-S-cluster containining protein